MPGRQQQRQLNVAVNGQADSDRLCGTLATGKDVNFSSNQQIETQRNCPHFFSSHTRFGSSWILGGGECVYLAVNNEVLIWCWREYGYPPPPVWYTKLRQPLERRHVTLFSTWNIFILKSPTLLELQECAATELNQHLLFPKSFWGFFCSSSGSDGNGVNNMPILHLCHSEACSWISTSDNEVICLRVARSPTEAGIH